MNKLSIKEIKGNSRTPLTDVKCVTCGNPDYPMYQMDKADRVTLVTARRVAQEHLDQAGNDHLIVISFITALK